MRLAYRSCVVKSGAKVGSCRPVRVIGAGGDRTPLTVMIFRDCALNALVSGARSGPLIGRCSSYFGRMLQDEADCVLSGAIGPHLEQFIPLLDFSCLARP